MDYTAFSCLPLVRTLKLKSPFLHATRGLARLTSVEAVEAVEAIQKPELSHHIQVLASPGGIEIRKRVVWGFGLRGKFLTTDVPPMHAVG